jgi:hypothetical protein
MITLKTANKLQGKPGAETRVYRKARLIRQ